MVALPQQALLLWRPHQVTSLCSHFATCQSLSEVHICRLPVRIWPCTRFSGPYHVIAPLQRDRYSEIINRQHEDFPSPKAKGKRSISPFQKLLESPQFAIAASPGKLASQGEEIRLLNGSLPEVFFTESFRLAKIPEREGCWCVFMCAHYSVLKASGSFPIADNTYRRLFKVASGESQPDWQDGPCCH